MKQDRKLNMLFVIGAGRSGTTLLAELLGRYSETFRVDEKRYVWTYGAYWRRHDVRHPEDATPKVRSYIQRYFNKIAANKMTPWLIEKTPSNCFRIGFVDQIFPGSRYVHIMRDGRAAAYSSYRAFFGEKVQDEIGSALDKRQLSHRVRYLIQRFPELIRRIKYGDLPPAGWLPYAVRKGEEVIQTLLSDKPALWGARYPGIEKDRSCLAPLALAALQWRMSIEAAQDGLKSYIPQDRRIEISYEALMDDPVQTLKTITEWAGIDANQADHVAAAKMVRKPVTEKWKQYLSSDEKALLDDYLKQYLMKLGYS